MLKGYELAVVLLLALLTTACESGNKHALSLSPSSSNSADIARCEQELQALKKINSTKYAELNGKFEQVMSGAVGYANVRGIVDPATQNAVDALYHFRSANLCAEIRTRMLEGLVSQSGVNQ